MTAVEAIRMAEELLALNDPYKVAERLIVLEGDASKQAIHEFAEELRASQREGQPT